MFLEYTTIFIFLIVGIAMVPLMLLIGKILRPHAPDDKKTSTYECGEIPLGSSWIQFNLRFYVIAFLFLIFDVEVAFMFPVASIFKQWTQAGFGQGWLAFIEVAIFVGILLVGFAYAWYKGDLNWVRPKKKE